MPKAFICGCAGLVLDAEERAFLRREDPWGLILFKRNVDDRDQVRALTRSFRECVGRPNAPVLIDQEGGRVQRMAPPHGRASPAAPAIGAGLEPSRAEAAARLVARLIAFDLAEVGITVDCAPVLDVAEPATHAAIGSRAFSSQPERVAAMGRAVAEGLFAGGVAPVVKHMPGHGRARADSHHKLPVVDAGLYIVLHCNGELDQARAVAFAAPQLSGSSLRRAEAALASISRPQPFDVEQGVRQLAAITAELGVA